MDKKTQKCTFVLAFLVVLCHFMNINSYVVHPHVSLHMSKYRISRLHRPCSSSDVQSAMETPLEIPTINIGKLDIKTPDSIILDNFSAVDVNTTTEASSLDTTLLDTPIDGMTTDDTAPVDTPVDTPAVDTTLDMPTRMDMPATDDVPAVDTITTLDTTAMLVNPIIAVDFPALTTMDTTSEETSAFGGEADHMLENKEIDKFDTLDALVAPESSDTIESIQLQTEAVEHTVDIIAANLKDETEGEALLETIPDQDVATIESSEIKDVLSESHQQVDPIEVVPETIIEVQEEVDPTVNIREKIIEEASLRDQRLKDYGVLKSKLQISINAKLEAEKALVREITILRGAMEEESSAEESRLKKLTALYDVIEKELIAKQTALSAESKILEEMKIVRDKINEISIVEQLDAAIAKKQLLLNIEENICNDVRSCADEINKEIDETNKNFSQLNIALSSLPTSTDSAAIRAYSWSEVESLQNMLLSNIENADERDRKIKSFVRKFDALMKKRGIILGVTPEGDEEKEEASSEQIMVRVNEEEVLDYDDIILADDPSIALRQTADSLVIASTSVMDIAKTYWQSDEGEQSRAALQEAFSGTNKVAGGLRSTFLAARKVWDFQLGDQSNIETTDEYVEKLATTANKVWKDAEVKESFDLVATGSKEAISGFTKAVQLTSSKIGQEVKNSKDFKSAVKSFTKGVGAFFGFLKKQATSNRGVPRSRTLPPSKL